MKWKKLTGCIPVAFVCLFASCDRQSETLQVISEDLPSATGIEEIITDEIDVINGLLSLPNGEYFEMLVRQLDEADSKWNDEFLLEVTGLTVGDLDGYGFSQIDAVAEQLEREEAARGINGDFVYENFERELRRSGAFKSLRSDLFALEEEFLNDTDPDWDNNPGDHYVDGTAEQTLLNAEGEIMVAGILYKFMPNGLIYEITDGDFHTLSEIGPEHAGMLFEAPNVVAHNTDVLDGRANCRTWVSNRGHWEYIADVALFRWKLGHRCFIFANNIFSTVKHYKKKGRKWKKRRAHLRTFNWGAYGLADPGNLNASCTRQKDYESIKKSRFRRRLTARQQTMGLGFGKVESGKVHAIFNANDKVVMHTLEF